MANILLIDDNAIAARSMAGILSRAGHRLVTAESIGEAWIKLRDLVKIDVIFMELRVQGQDGFNFLTPVRADPLLKGIPIIITASSAEQAIVRKALGLKVQNFLVKPIHDVSVYNEIAKATTNQWRSQLFETEKSFCAQMGFGPATLKKMREKVIDEIDKLNEMVPQAESGPAQKPLLEQLDTLLGDAEASGIWGVVELATEIKEKTDINAWTEVPGYANKLTLARRLVFFHINPEQVPTGFISGEEAKALEEAAEHSRWMDADVGRNGPLSSRMDVLERIEKLPSCPVVDTAAATFSIYANGQAANLGYITDVVCKDPGLCACILSAVNKIEKKNNTCIDDPKVAISLLGELRLQTISRNLPCMEERCFQAPPFNWPHFWLFQSAVANTARFACAQMEIHGVDTQAYYAGMMHDLGKLVLAKIYPHALPAIIQHAKQHSLSLNAAASRYLEIDITGIALAWAENSDLSDVFKSVIRWVDTPAAAERDQEMVAVIALARHICVDNHMGSNGEPSRPAIPLADTEAWKVLHEHIYPSFNLSVFEAQAHVFAHALRIELMGRMRLSPNDA